MGAGQCPAMGGIGSRPTDSRKLAVRVAGAAEPKSAISTILERIQRKSRTLAREENNAGMIRAVTRSPITQLWSAAWQAPSPPQSPTFPRQV